MTTCSMSNDDKPCQFDEFGHCVHCCECKACLKILEDNGFEEEKPYIFTINDIDDYNGSDCSYTSSLAEAFPRLRNLRKSGKAHIGMCSTSQEYIFDATEEELGDFKYRYDHILGESTWLEHMVDGKKETIWGGTNPEDGYYGGTTSRDRTREAIEENGIEEN